MDTGASESPEALESVVREMKIKEPDEPIDFLDGSGMAAHDVETEFSSDSQRIPSRTIAASTSVSPTKAEPSIPLPKSDDEEEKVIKADVVVKQEPGEPPKLSRTASQKVSTKAASLYLDYADKTDEATSSFQVISDCIYAAKYLGATEHALECDCPDEWGMYGFDHLFSIIARNVQRF